MKNIWIPHIPKNGGTTIVGRIKRYCSLHQDKFIFKLLYGLNEKTLIRKQLTETEVHYLMNDVNLLNHNFLHGRAQRVKPFVEIKNKNTNNIIRIGHFNPLEKGMEDWLKILIIRYPIDRIISFYTNILFRYVKTINKEGYLRYNNFLKIYSIQKFSSHTDFLTKIQNTYKIDNNEPIITTFNIDNVKHIFDYIFNITDHSKVTNLIEKHFLQTKIEWPKINNTREKLNNTILENIRISESYLEKIKNKSVILEDLKFYEKYMDTSYS